MKHYFQIVILSNGAESPGDTAYASFGEALAARYFVEEEAQKIDGDAIIAIDEYLNGVKQVRCVPAGRMA